MCTNTWSLCVCVRHMFSAYCKLHSLHIPILCKRRMDTTKNRIALAETSSSLLWTCEHTHIHDIPVVHFMWKILEDVAHFRIKAHIYLDCLNCLHSFSPEALLLFYFGQTFLDEHFVRFLYPKSAYLPFPIACKFQMLMNFRAEITLCIHL